MAKAETRIDVVERDLRKRTYSVHRQGRTTSVLSIEPNATKLSALGLNGSMLAETFA